MDAVRRTIEVPGTAQLEIFTVSAPVPGPRLAVFGGVHGDEPEGVFAAHALTRLSAPLARGSLIVVPVAHPEAFTADAREAPGGGNLARVFPGDANGTPLQRTAAALTGILDKADLLIDLHTAGRHYDMPLLAGYVDIGGEAGARSRQMADWFAADFVWRHPPGGRGRTLSVMAAARKPAIYTEAPGGGTLNRPVVQRFVDGVARVMVGLGMVDGAPPPPHEARRVAGSGNMDVDVTVAPYEACFVRQVEAGELVGKGQEIGRLETLEGNGEAMIAPQDGYVMYLRRTARVETGIALAALAVPDE